jgi:hypothetical protein
VATGRRTTRAPLGRRRSPRQEAAVPEAPGKDKVLVLEVLFLTLQKG